MRAITRASGLTLRGGEAPAGESSSGEMCSRDGRHRCCFLWQLETRDLGGESDGVHIDPVSEPTLPRLCRAIV